LLKCSIDKKHTQDLEIGQKNLWNAVVDIAAKLNNYANEDPTEIKKS